MKPHRLIRSLTRLTVLLYGVAQLSRGAESTRPSPAERDPYGDPKVAHAQGAATAQKDLSRGILQIQCWGLPGPTTADYQRLLQEKYQIEMHWLGGCLVSDGLVEYGRGYNEVSRRAIETRYGTNFFAEVKKRVEPPTSPPSPINEPSTPLSPGRDKTQATSYRIRAGDTLSKIARDHHTSLRSLMTANPGIDPNRLTVNQSLRLPPGKGSGGK